LKRDLLGAILIVADERERKKVKRPLQNVDER
jgi:hypothetical protein